MSEAWVIILEVFDVTDDGIIEPESRKYSVSARNDFEEAKKKFLSRLQEIGNTDGVYQDFLMHVSEDELYDDDEEISENNRDVMKNAFEKLFSGQEMTDCPEGEIYTWFEDLGSLILNNEGGVVTLESDDEGSGCRPVLNTNALVINNTNIRYFLELENWFGGPHKYFIAEMIPVDLD